MQIFTCPACGGRIYFENMQCRCGLDVAFDPDASEMRLDATFCRNRDEISCNWVAAEGGFCRSCAMTETVPDIGAPQNRPLWARTEASKRWMLANLARWGWFTASDPGRRPVFKLLSEETSGGEAKVTMGHANGVITINVSEASDATLQERKEKLGELYRTMLGHMRHEMAHFLFLRLAEDETFLEAFRALFGDERQDYGEALREHYAEPKSPDENHVTSYAQAHPHEDWAETTAHLLHLTDLLDSAASAGLSLPDGPHPGYDAYAETESAALLNQAISVAIAVNQVTRSMNVDDPYPFILPPGVRRKIGFVHDALRST